jgi:hypothetical protein
MSAPARFRPGACCSCLSPARAHVQRIAQRPPEWMAMADLVGTHADATPAAIAALAASGGECGLRCTPCNAGRGARSIRGAAKGQQRADQEGPADGHSRSILWVLHGTRSTTGTLRYPAYLGHSRYLTVPARGGGRGLFGARTIKKAVHLVRARPVALTSVRRWSAARGKRS